MKNLVRRMYEEAWNENKLEVIDEICAADYVGVGPYGNEIGPEAVKRGVTSRRLAFPDIHVTIEDMIAEEDKIVARLTFRGTHSVWCELTSSERGCIVCVISGWRVYEGTECHLGNIGKMPSSKA